LLGWSRFEQITFLFGSGWFRVKRAEQLSALRAEAAHLVRGVSVAERFRRCGRWHIERRVMKRMFDPESRGQWRRADRARSAEHCAASRNPNLVNGKEGKVHVSFDRP
jgi:hypothetical protein